MAKPGQHKAAEQLAKRVRQQKKRKKIQRKRNAKKPDWTNALKSKYKKGQGDRGNKDGEEAELQEEIDEEKLESLNKKSPLERQVFLSGVPLDVNETQLEAQLARFGSITKTFIVRSRTTKAPTGAAFVHFKTEESVQGTYNAALANANEVNAMLKSEKEIAAEDISRRQLKRNEAKQTVTTMRAAPFVEINNVRVTVRKAISRVAAMEQSATGATTDSKKKEKKTRTGAEDPRHLYLLREGMVEPGTAAARDLPRPYVDALVQDYEARKAQLRDTNKFVSPVRLSIRNMPRDKFGEPELRKLVQRFVRDYLKLHPEELDKSKWGKFGPIKSLKVLKTSSGVSKGYGFVELASHPLALHALRHINNNPTLFGPNKRLVVSFAIEDANTLQVLKRRKALKELRSKRNRDGDDEDENEEG